MRSLTRRVRAASAAALTIALASFGAAVPIVAQHALPAGAATCPNPPPVSPGPGVDYGTSGNDTMNDSGSGVGLTIYGGDGNDTITGTAYDDIIYGAGGSDTIHGGGGNDIIYGDNNDSVCDSGSWADTIYGDTGDDTIHGGTG